MKLLGVLLAAFLAVPAAAQSLDRVQVVNDRAPDCSSLAAIVQSVTKDCKTDDELGDRDLQLLPLRPLPPRLSKRARRDFGFEADQRLWLVVMRRRTHGAGRALGGGGLPVALSGLERSRTHDRRGFLRRPMALPGHVPEVLRLDARSAAPGGRTIAGQEDIRANPALVTEALVADSARKVSYQADNRFEYVGDKVNWTAPAFLVCGDTLEGVLSGIRSSRNAGSPAVGAGSSSTIRSIRPT